MRPDDVIQEFGQLVGFQSLEVNKNGVVHMSIDGIGELFIDEKFLTESGNCVFIYLLRTYERPDGNLYRRALALCDYKSGEEFPSNPVLHGTQILGFAVKCSVDSFDLKALQEIIRKLKDLQDRLSGDMTS
ncbi:MAG: hypothetical protein LBR91_01735 [Puniceicoccales bacterium]|jgi:type III secretion system chaperone SycN|nr:hypothetical protein [Puniceicoccales bacterium]